MQKIRIGMYKHIDKGYTINRKGHRQKKIQKIDKEILHIKLLSGKPKFP